ncbi:hypothetical protein ABZ612_33950 [Streptomyces avermitilis]|uniref:hypothetical protein n=1 Tax=Streptomyces avermitilis TaxID=33903 RepID=UPI0033DC9FF9
MPATRALVASQTGRVHAALGDKHQAEQYLGVAGELLADGLADHVPEWANYFDTVEHAGPLPTACMLIVRRLRPMVRAISFPPMPSAWRRRISASSSSVTGSYWLGLVTSQDVPWPGRSGGDGRARQ